MALVLSESPALPAHRSDVPDLLFEDQRDARVEEIRPYLEDVERLDGSFPLHRLTVFATYRCNLACPYCKTIARSPEELDARPQKRLAFDLRKFAALMDSHAGTPIRHVHFTGGEASLVHELPQMVALARRHGVARLSITTNGTLPLSVYRDLVAAGMDEIRVSLDAADPETGERLTLRPGSWSRAVATVQALAADRRAGASFFLIVNTVVTRENRGRIDEIVRFLIGLGPDDVKLITDVDLRGQLTDFPGAREVLERLSHALDGQPAEAFPLLRRKLETVFAPDATGLERVAPAPSGDWRCYIPMTERTVDGTFYYPCSVHLRKGGRPLGKIDEPQAVQRAMTAAFVRRGDCLEDPIYRRHCLHCTREDNVRANEARRDPRA